MMRRRIVWLTAYAVAMGLLEAIVVVYLRELFYPRGFDFPIVLIEGRTAVAELVREATTLVMLLAVAVLAGRDRLDRFFVFGLLFGVWDLVYYAGLWLFLGWPPSLMTWDILFLIPVPWLSPVIYPVVISSLLVAGFVVHERLRRAGRTLRPSRAEWTVAVAGGLTVVVSLCWHWRIVAEGGVPTEFPTTLFSAGTVLGLLPLARAARRARR